MIIDTLFKEFTRLENSDQQAFLQQAISYMDQDEDTALTPEQEDEIMRRIELIESGQSIFYSVKQVKDELM